MLNKNVIEMVLDEMLARGLPRDVYDQFKREAVRDGLIPVPGQSEVGGRKLTEDDILRAADILTTIPEDVEVDYGWYGVG
jgi:hypothetical protein